MDVVGRHSRLTSGMQEPVTVQIIGRRVVTEVRLATLLEHAKVLYLSKISVA
jgi:hypothetical protein